MVAPRGTVDSPGSAVADRPYTVLSCRHVARRLPRRRVRAAARPVQRRGPRPGRRGPGRLRRDPGRRRHGPQRRPPAAWCAAGARRAERSAPAAYRVTDQGDRHRQRASWTRAPTFFRAGDTEKLVYCASSATAGWRASGWLGGHRGRRRAAGATAVRQRGPARPRGTATAGRGWRHGPHPVPHRRSWPTSCSWSSHRSSWVTRARRRFVDDGRVPVERRPPRQARRRPAHRRRRPAALRALAPVRYAVRGRRGPPCACRPRRSARRSPCRCGFARRLVDAGAGCSPSTGWSTGASTWPSGSATAGPRAAGPAAQRVPHR